MTPPVRNGSVPDVIVTARDLRKEYGDVAAVDGVDLDLERGSVTALVGPNGAGKSTLMRLLCGLLDADEGRVLVDGVDAAAEPRKVRSLYGFLPDVYGFREEMTPREVLGYFADAYRIPAHLGDARASELLTFVRLDGVADKPVGRLSRGMRQRLGIARALIHDPPIVFLDEPAAGLDPDNRRELQALFKSISAAGKTLLVSSHILTELEEYCTHAVLLRAGRVGAADRLARLVAGPLAAQTMRLRAVRGLEKAEALLSRRPGVSGLEASGPDLRFRLACTDEEAAALLAELLAAGVQVAAFGAETRSFEDAYRSWSAEEAG
ncbi:ABC transporter ATP-binding protein [bacterium]|nr:MAG: ABC transporter ATP-binding protein [bacterium]